MWMVPGAPTIEEHIPPAKRELEDLLTAIAAGDREALGTLYRRTRGPVYAMALSVLGDPQEAQDVTQDVFVRVWEGASGYRRQGTPMAWILTVARNLALMSRRREERRAELTPEEWAAIPASEPSLSREDSQLLREALARLGEEERQVIFLHALSGLKHREIAALLDLPLSTVLSKYQRGLKKLRIQIEGEKP